MDIENILNEIEKIYPNPQTELYYNTPFQLLVAVVLSAQTTDKQVNKITRDQWLFDKIKTPKDVLKLWYENLREKIKTIGLTNSKSKNIYKLSSKILEFTNPETKQERRILENYWYIIPSFYDKIITLPWVWEKTAKVVLSVLFDKPTIPVDTHVHRVVNRLGVVKTAYPEQTSKELEKIIPDDLKNKSHHLLILFWRYFCTAKNPSCKICPFAEFCRYYNNKL